MLLAADFASNLEATVCILSLHVHVVKGDHLQYQAIFFFLVDELEINGCSSALKFYFFGASSEVISFKM